MSLSSSAKETRCGADSVEMPDFPPPAAQRAPDGCRKPPPRCAICPRDPGASQLGQEVGTGPEVGTRRPPWSPERCHFCFLSSKGGG